MGAQDMKDILVGIFAKGNFQAAFLIQAWFRSTVLINQTKQVHVNMEMSLRVMDWELPIRNNTLTERQEI